MKKLLEETKKYLEKEEVNETEEYISAYSLYKKLDKNLEFARNLEEAPSLVEQINLCNEKPLTLMRKIKNRIHEDPTCIKVETYCYQLDSKIVFVYKQKDNIFNEIVYKHRDIEELEYFNCKNSKMFIEENQEKVQEILLGLEKYHDIFKYKEKNQIEIIDESFFIIEIMYNAAGNISVNIIPKEQVITDETEKGTCYSILNNLSEYILKRAKVDKNKINPVTKNIVFSEKETKHKQRVR